MMEKEKLFVKLGGAAITLKDQPGQANHEAISRATEELAEVHASKELLIGTGGGSFPHPVAKKYNVQQGLEACGAEGFVKTHEAAAEINSLVTKELIKKGMPAVPVQTSAITMMSNGRISEMYTPVIENLLNEGMVPVVYGDVALDSVKGCAVASTEMIFKHLAEKLSPKRLVIATDVKGVYSSDPKKGDAELIPLINEENIKDVLSLVSGASTTDVTGGMAHKVQELYNLSKLNIQVEIISLLEPGLLKRAVQGETGLGTSVRLTGGE